MVAKDGWKLTEVGPVPEDWEVYCLSSHFRIYAGGDVPKHSVSPHRSATHPHPIFANALQNRGLYGFTAERRAESDCLTITARGFIGHAEYRNEDFFPIVRLLVLEPFGLLDARFTSFAVNERVSFALESTGVPQLTAPQVGRYSIAAPQIYEQREISTVLSDADAAIESLDALIAKKRDVKQATMQQLLAGRTRLPGFTADWKEVRLGEICELSLAASKKSRTDGRGRYIIADMGSVSKDGSFLTHKTTDVRDDVLRTGDLVMPKDDIGGGQIIGKAVLVDEDERYVLGDHVYRLRLSDGFPAFVRYGINSYKVNIQLRSKVVGSAQLGLGRRAVLEQPISFPPLKEQEAIAEALSVMDEELEALAEQVSKMRMVKEGMMQDLLTGKVRLV